MSKSLIPFIRRGAILTVAVALSSCAVVETDVPELPESDIPSEWFSPTDPDAAVWPELDWWNNFENEELTSIIEQVKSNNFDLQNNERNLRNAELAFKNAQLDLLPIPTVDLSTGFTYNESRTNSSGTPGDFSLSANAGYNNILTIPDTFERAKATYESQVAGHANTILSTLSSAASLYFQLLYNRDQRETAELNLENLEAIYEIAQARVEAGVNVPIQALQTQIRVENQRNQIRQLEQSDLSIRASLSILIGEGVEGFNIEGESLAEVAVPAVQPGIPSELLRRSPSLVQAEIRLRNAAINVDQAYLSLFPSISLTGTAGASSSSLIDVLTSPNTSFSIISRLTQRLLDDGTRYRDLETSRNNLENELNNYRRTVITAFNNVEVQLNNIAVINQQLNSQELTLENAEESYGQAELQYQEGVSSFEELLTSQNSVISARTAFLQYRQQQLNAILNLYQTLGGGWEMPESGSE